MKAYLTRLAEDYEKVLDFLVSEKAKAALKKISGRLLPGAKCAWCYEDDVAFWKSEGLPYPHPKDWPYHGFIVPFPETDGRHEMDVEHVCLVVTSYPIEKENPMADWSCLVTIFELGELHRFYVFEPIKLQQPQSQPLTDSLSSALRT